MELSIIIVSYNVREKLRENLQALAKSEGGIKFEIIIIDNNSTDGSAAMIAEEFKNILLINNSGNLGFAKACNQGIKKAQGDFILLLNPDMRVFPDTLKNMLAWMRANPQADVAGCNLVDEQGNSIKHVRRFPAVWDQLAIILKLPHLYPGVLKKYLRYDFDYSQAAPVDSIRGGFFLMRAGEGHPVPLWLDERYFLWFEEVDFCRKIKEAGGQVWYTPAAKCIDLVGQSFKQLKRVQAQKYFRASMLEYFRKWHHPWEHRLLRLAWPVGLFITWTGEKLKIKTGTTT